MRFSVALDVARRVGLASFAGILAGVVVGGLLGRLAMRVSGAMSAPGLIGTPTSNGNLVGNVTFEGTLALVVFVGVASGLVGGALYAPVEPWLRRVRPWHGAAYGAALLGTFGFTVLEPTNVDFQRFGSAPVNVAVFAALFLAFGVLLAWLFDRLHAQVGGRGRAALATEIVAWLSLVAVAAVTIFVIVPAIAGSPDLAFPVVGSLGLAVAVVVRWRGLPDLVGYAALAAPLLMGLARLIPSVPELLAAL